MSTTILRVTVPGEPVPKARPRVVDGHTYTPSRTKQAEERLQWAFRQALPPGFVPTTEPVVLVVEFYRESKRRVDGDNLQKLVQDAMNGIVVADDSQIKMWGGKVFDRTDRHGGACTVIEVKTLN